MENFIDQRKRVLLVGQKKCRMNGKITPMLLTLAFEYFDGNTIPLKTIAGITPVKSPSDQAGAKALTNRTYLGLGKKLTLPRLKISLCTEVKILVMFYCCFVWGLGPYFAKKLSQSPSLFMDR